MCAAKQLSMGQNGNNEHPLASNHFKLLSIEPNGHDQQSVYFTKRCLSIGPLCPFYMSYKFKLFIETPYC